MIVFDKVSFQYGNEETDEPSSGIHNISFHIGKGQCAILCGRSGAGKSTVLRLVSGLMPNFYTGELSGTVTVNGKYPGVFLPDEKVQTLGVVFQGPFLMVLKQFIPVIAINVVFTLADKNISKTGHLGGFVGGVIAMLVLIGSGLCVY